MKISHQFGLAALACSALLATSASATAYNLGSSYGGLFGGGESVTFDDFTSQPGPVSYTNPAGTLGVSYVGDVFGVFSTAMPGDPSWAPVVGGGYTSITVLGDYGVEALMFDFAQTFAPSAQMSLFYQVIGTDGSTLGTGKIAGLNYKAYNNYTAYYDGALIKEVRAYGASSFTGTDTASGTGGISPVFNPGPDTLDSGLLDNVYVTDLHAVLAAAVPEPSSWALMLVGFAGLGTMLRFSRRTHQRVRATA